MKKLRLVPLVLVAALLLTACGGAKSTASSNSGSSGSGGSTTFTVATEPTFPPFETKTNGKITGFDVDVVDAIAKQENLTPKWKSMKFSGIIPALQAHQIDSAAAGITIKKSRMQAVNFTNAYYLSGLAMVVKADNNSIKKPSDLKGKCVATKKATTSVDYVHQNIPGVGQLKQFDHISNAYQLVENGGCDAVIFDYPPDADYVSSHKDMKIAGDLLTGEYYGFAVDKSNTDLLNKLNDGLKKIQDDGTYMKLYNKYFTGKNGAVTSVKKPADVATTD